MTTPHVLWIGAGDLAKRCAPGLLDLGWQFTAVSRSSWSHSAPGFNHCSANYASGDGFEALTNLQPDFVIFTPLPVTRDVRGYQQGYADSVTRIAEAGVLERCQRFLYVSSTRVFAESEGGWVDEEAALSETDPLAQAIQLGEQQALDFAPSATILRPSGIYGSWPGMLIERVRRGVATADQTRFSNRIHRDDLARCIIFLLECSNSKHPLPERIIASDSEPTPLAEVERWLADRLGLGLQTPPLDSGQPARANRRCDNRLLKSLGFELRYPSYREGYASMFAQHVEGEP